MHGGVPETHIAQPFATTRCHKLRVIDGQLSLHAQPFNLAPDAKLEAVLMGVVGQRGAIGSKRKIQLPDQAGAAENV